MELPNPLIAADPERMSGAPVFARTRVPVQNHFDDLEGPPPRKSSSTASRMTRGSTRLPFSRWRIGRPSIKCWLWREGRISNSRERPMNGVLNWRSSLAV